MGRCADYRYLSGVPGNFLDQDVQFIEVNAFARFKADNFADREEEQEPENFQAPLIGHRAVAQRLKVVYIVHPEIQGTRGNFLNESPERLEPGSCMRSIDQDLLQRENAYGRDRKFSIASFALHLLLPAEPAQDLILNVGGVRVHVNSIVEP